MTNPFWDNGPISGTVQVGTGASTTADIADDTGASNTNTGNIQKWCRDHPSSGLCGIVNPPATPAAGFLGGMPFSGVASTIEDDTVKDTPKHLSKLLQDAGFGGKSSNLNTTFRGIVGAESGFDPKIYNGSCCYGLAQIHINHAGTCGIPADQDRAIAWLKIPENNLAAAHCVYKAQGLDAWETYTNGSYKRFTGQDPLIVGSGKHTVDTVVSDAVNTVVDPLASVGKLIGSLFDPSTWVRIGKGIAGYGFVVIGVGMLVFVVAGRALNSGAGRAVTGAMPQTKALRTVKSVARAAK